MEIKIRTLTPIWTGGVEKTCDRIHETGIIGSLRWWYEAIVRGLGSYACDPTSEESEKRCFFDNKAYEKAKANGHSDDAALNIGLKTVCPACFLFGATGWARLFQLRAIEVPMTPLHFRSTLTMNRGWLEKVFGDQNSNINTLQVPFGNLHFQFITRRHDNEYARNQFALILRVAAEYGGIGAKLQHGFGQVVFPQDFNDISILIGLLKLKAKIESNFFRSEGPVFDTPYDLNNFISLTYHIDKDKFNAFKQRKTHVGSEAKTNEIAYLPCAFDLRYKGSDNKFGMRRWLKQKGWKESNNPKKLEELDLLFGPRSKWKVDGKEKEIDEKLRTASRVLFGMPYIIEDTEDYALRVWAFWTPEIKNRLPDPKSLQDLCIDYVRDVFDVEPSIKILGKDIINSVVGETR